MFKIAAVAFALIAAAPIPFGQQIISGLVCYEERSSELLAQMYRDSGEQLENEVADDLVTQGACIRIAPINALRGYTVYEGATIGEKKIMGYAPTPHEAPQLFGMEWATPPPASGPHVPAHDEA